MTAKDPFARETAQHAHRKLAEFESKMRHDLATLQRVVSRKNTFRDRCYLCGDPCRKGSVYCHAHSWAEGR